MTEKDYNEFVAHTANTRNDLFDRDINLSKYFFDHQSNMNECI